MGLIFYRSLSGDELDQKADDEGHAGAQHEDTENNSHNAGGKLILVIHSEYLLLGIDLDLLDFNVFFLKQCTRGRDL